MRFALCCRLFRCHRLTCVLFTKTIPAERSTPLPLSSKLLLSAGNNKRNPNMLPIRTATNSSGPGDQGSVHMVCPQPQPCASPSAISGSEAEKKLHDEWISAVLRCDGDASGVGGGTSFPRYSERKALQPDTGQAEEFSFERSGVNEEADTPKSMTVADWRDEEFTMKAFYPNNSSNTGSDAQWRTARPPFYEGTPEKKRICLAASYDPYTEHDPTWALELPRTPEKAQMLHEVVTPQFVLETPVRMLPSPAIKWSRSPVFLRDGAADLFSPFAGGPLRDSSEELQPFKTVGRDRRQSLKDLNERLKSCALANGSSPPATPSRAPGDFARGTPSPALDVGGTMYLPGASGSQGASSAVRLSSGQKIDGITVNTLRHSHPLLL